MKTFVLANQKGGVGKSAVACQLAHYLAAQGKRVLVIDLDHQRNTSSALRKHARFAVAAFSSSAMLAGAAAELPEAACVLIAGDEALSGLERQLAQHNAYANSIHSFVEEAAARFDVCVIDTNPNPDIRYAVAMIVADFVLSPIQLNQEALDGINGLLNHKRYGYNKIKAAINPRLELIGLLPNLVEPTPFQKGNFLQLVQQHAELLIAMDGGAGRYAALTTRTAIAEAQAAGLYLGEMRKTSARDAFREMQPCLQAIAQRMALEA